MNAVDNSQGYEVIYNKNTINEASSLNISKIKALAKEIAQLKLNLLKLSEVKL